MDYGLWLLAALLIIILLVFLLSGRRKAGEVIDTLSQEQPASPVPSMATDPIAVGDSPDEQAAQAAALMSHTGDVHSVADDDLPPAPVEPVPVAAPVAAAPAPAPITPSAEAGATDDLLQLKGVGPKLQALLFDLGVTRFAQIAAWKDADIAAVDARLGSFKGRPVRDQWVDQAKYLAAGDIAGFEAKYGKL